MTATTTTVLDPRHMGVENRQAMMDDARKMQAATEKACREAGIAAPPYLLSELIGKGTYGRVYKAADRQTGELVAIKMVDIEAGDGAGGPVDTFGDMRQEIATLKHLRDVGAANVNLVVDACLVGQSMWIVTEYCAGGSVATLMKPFFTAAAAAAVAGRRGPVLPLLDEKWIIPILREVAEAVRWIHSNGVIHRDIKCANIFITQEGGVQLGDFGVAAMVQTKFDKRSTVIGTLHWMAPELFDPVVSYGPAVDIWALGSVAYEMASGLPPNAMESRKARINPSEFGQFLNEHLPRLEGPQYSEALKDLVAFCLEKSPDRRPTIERVVEHAYIRNTASAYPTASLSKLVRNYRRWEQQGGVRHSLLDPSIGAQVADACSSNWPVQDEWNFSTTLEFDQQVDNHNSPDQKTGLGATRGAQDVEQDIQPGPKGRRRPPPHVLARLKAPLEKVFDPNTISNYPENSSAYYGGGGMKSSSAPDLPLRDDSHTADIRESLIDLDGSLVGFETPELDDMATIRPYKAPPQSTALKYKRPDTGFANPANRGPARSGLHIHTTTPPSAQEHKMSWRWPTNNTPLVSRSSSLGTRRFTGNKGPFNGHRGIDRPSGGDRSSLASLIDLDESALDESTIDESTIGSAITTSSAYHTPSTPRTVSTPWTAATYCKEQGLTMSPFELERRQQKYHPHYPHHHQQHRPPPSSTPLDTPPRSAVPSSAASSAPTSNDDDVIWRRGMVAPPSAQVMEGRATRQAVADEMTRLLASLSGHLGDVGRQVKMLEPRRADGSTTG